MSDIVETTVAAISALEALLEAGAVLPQDIGAHLAALVGDAQPLPEEKVIQLRKPVTIASQTYSEIKLHEPSAAEWMQWHKLSGVDADVKAISVVGAIPEAAVRQLGARDLLEASRYIARFLE